MVPLLRLAALTLLAFGSAASAKPTQIEVEPAGAYQHQSTGFVLPTVLGGLQRSKVTTADVGDLDIWANYGPADESEMTSIFLFRNVSADVPVWFDRAVSAVEQRTNVYGSLTPLVRAAPFVPPGQPAASGLKSVYAASGKPFASTAVAVASVAGFYVKLRLSSATLTPAQLDARLAQTIQEMGWPRNGAVTRAAVAVAPCPSPLKFKREAKRAANDLTTALLGAALAVTETDEEKKAPPAAKPLWCRDLSAVESGAVYRPGGSSDAYLIAMHDSGRALSVNRNGLGAVLSGSNTQRYSVDLIMLGEQLGYGDFQSLPPPQQVMRLLKDMDPIYRTTTTGKGSKITLDRKLAGD